MSALTALWSRIVQVISIVKFTDVLDILIITFLIYQVFALTRTKSAGQIVRVVALLLVLTYLSSILNLHALNYVLSRLIEVGLIALVVVFQPELRRIMEQFGGASLRGFLTPKSHQGDSEQTVLQTVAACREMSQQKIGVLIVFERENNLEQYFSTGTVVNADVSSELLKNIFFPKAALHDGAVVIRADRVAAAGCVLPLTENPNLSRDLGTRHRAAIGISEHSDAVVVVVSEETGVISCAEGGNLKRYLTPETLEMLLREKLVAEEESITVTDRIHGLVTWIKGKRGETDDAEE